MANIVDFLNRQITIPEKPETQTPRTTTYIPEVGEIGFNMEQELSPILKQRLEKMSDAFPHDGMTPEEAGALKAMADISTQVVDSARDYVKATDKIGGDTVTLYDLEQQHKANFLKHDLGVKKIDAKHAGALQSWQSNTEKIVNDVRTKVAYLKAIQSAM